MALPCTLKVSQPFHRNHSFPEACKRQEALALSRRQRGQSLSRKQPECLAVRNEAGSGEPLKVKICGITRPDDAAAAASAGATFAGMILWPNARRHVDLQLATEIATAARDGGAEPVGVFVDADAAEIERVCSATGIRTAQLHGDLSRLAFLDIPQWLSVIYVAHVDPTGSIVTPLPSDGKEQPRGDVRIPQWLLLDGMQGGSGTTLDWATLRVPGGDAFSRGWILAGGLTPRNVRKAVAALSPSCVDVSSGVCGPDGLAKDHRKIREFIQEATMASSPC